MSWQLERAVQREEEALQEAYERGELTAQELSSEIRELHRSAREELEQEAEDAYDRVIGGDW